MPKLHIKQKPKNSADSISYDEKQAIKAWKNLASEYSSVYTKWPYSAVQSVRPSSNGNIVAHDHNALDLNTIYKDKYIRHTPATPIIVNGQPYYPFIRSSMLAWRLAVMASEASLLVVQRVQQARVPLEHHCIAPYVKSTCPVRTTYENDYKNHPIDVRAPFIPIQVDPHPMKETDYVKTISTNQATFKAYDVPDMKFAKRELITKPENGILPLPRYKNSFSTTTRRTYCYPDTPPERRTPFKYEPEMSRSKSAMELQTTQRSDFTEKICASTSYHAPCRTDREPKWRPIDPRNCSEMKTTFQEQYPNHGRKTARPKSCKPSTKFVKSSIPFHANTLYKDAYRDKIRQLDRQQAWAPKDNLRVVKEASFHDLTQYNETHSQSKDHIYKRIPLMKPTTSESHKWPPFCGDTSYKIDFRHFLPSDVGAVKTYKPIVGYKPPPAFQGESTSHKHFQGLSGPPGKLIRPAVKPRLEFAIPVQG